MIKIRQNIQHTFNKLEILVLLLIYLYVINDTWEQKKQTAVNTITKCYFCNLAKCFDVKGSVFICDNPVVLMQYVTIDHSIYDSLFLPNLMHKFYILIHLLHSSTCFEHYCAHLQEDNCINTASGIVTLFG